jgi:hypothetical protein
MEEKRRRRRSRFSFLASDLDLPASKSFNDLPEEIVLLLASFLNARDLVRTKNSLDQSQFSKIKMFLSVFHK